MKTKGKKEYVLSEVLIILGNSDIITTSSELGGDIYDELPDMEPDD